MYLNVLHIGAHIKGPIIHFKVLVLNLFVVELKDNLKSGPGINLTPTSPRFPVVRGVKLKEKV